MKDLTEKKIQQSIEGRKKSHLTFLENVKTYRPFLEVEEKAFRNGALSKKTKELMALSISIMKKSDNLRNSTLEKLADAMNLTVEQLTD